MMPAITARWKLNCITHLDGNDQPPVSPKNLIVKAQREKSETCVMNSRKYNRAEALRQVNDITVEMVQEKIDSIAKILKF